ncbi:MAG: hypothetical protein HJJLKODD_02714 [Phycisphaerae bacterium]|nr:hypothetical protein [Phycisphaerae bacterium]
MVQNGLIRGDFYSIAKSGGLGVNGSLVNTAQNTSPQLFSFWRFTEPPARVALSVLKNTFARSNVTPGVRFAPSPKTLKLSDSHS